MENNYLESHSFRSKNVIIGFFFKNQHDVMCLFFIYLNIKHRGHIKNNVSDEKVFSSKLIRPE